MRARACVCAWWVRARACGAVRAREGPCCSRAQSCTQARAGRGSVAAAAGEPAGGDRTAVGRILVKHWCGLILVKHWCGRILVKHWCGRILVKHWCRPDSAGAEAARASGV